MCTYFNTKNDVAQNLIDDRTMSEDLSIGRILSGKKYGGTRLISEKTEVLYAELNERAEAATGSYSVTGDFLQYIYSVPVTRNHRNIRSRSDLDPV